VQKKVGIAVVLVVLGVAGYIGWNMMRWSVVYRMKVDEVMLKKVARFPSTETVIAIPDLMKEAAVAAKVPTEGLRTDVVLEGRHQGPVVFWYVVVTVSDGKHDPLRAEQRVENEKVLLADAERLDAAQVKIKKP
jgi:hypothetical protein